MKFHYGGQYSGNPEDLPHSVHEEGSVQFKEPSDMKTLSTIISIISLVLLALLFALIYIRSGSINAGFMPYILYIPAMFVHEMLHAVCYKEDVYLYHNLKNMMLFVIGTERISKGRFILKSLLPSIVLGIIPFIIFMINPFSRTLGIFGALGIASSAGDYYNVFNTITQVPAGAKVYLDKMNTYWYMPKK